VDRASLFIFLHECGHVHLKHLTRAVKLPTWREEYEADQYAIAAMRALKLPLPRERLREAKQVLRDDIVKGQHKHEEIDEEVLKYAYGKNWRYHR
jgi:hypothetical protein